MRIPKNRRPIPEKDWRQYVPQIHKFSFVSLSVIAFIAVSILFSKSFDYGAYIYESGQSQTLKILAKTLKGLTQADLAVAKNIAKSQLSHIEEVNVDIKFKHLQRLHYLREIASQQEFIPPETKQEEFPAKLTYGGQMENVKISLTGKISRIHVGSPNKWSFQVKVRGDATVAGMKRFGVLVPTSRGYLTDWIAMEMMKERGLIGMRIDFVDLTINGKSQGIFYLEERFDKHLVENNHLREGILFKLGKRVMPYQEEKIIADSSKRAQFLLLSRMWQSVMDGQLPADKFFDMNKLAKLFVITDLMNVTHPLNKENLRFYFNPVTGLAEPIAREFDNLSNSDYSSMKVFFQEPIPLSSHYWQKQEAIIGTIFKDISFQRAYIQEASVIADPKFLDEFLARNESKVTAVQKKLHRYVPFYSLPTDILYKNQAYIASKIFPKKSQLKAFFHERTDNTVCFRLKNSHCFPLEIVHLAIGDSLKFYPVDPLIPVASDRDSSDILLHFTWPSSLPWSDEIHEEVTIHYFIAGLKSHPLHATIDPRQMHKAVSNEIKTQKEQTVAELTLHQTVKEVLSQGMAKNEN